MSMYNLLEYSQNCSMISGNLWNYSRDQINDDDDDDDDYNASDGKSLKYKTKIIAKTEQKQDLHDQHNHQRNQMDLNHHNQYSYQYCL